MNIAPYIPIILISTVMKKARLFLLVGSLASILIIICFLILTKEAQNKWSQPVNGIQAMLSSHRSTYRVGQSIEIFIKFRNVGDTVKTLKMPSFYASLSIACNGEVFAEPIGSYPKGVNVLTLFPGQTSEKFFLSAGRTDLEGPGLYEISGAMGDGEQWGWEFETLKVGVYRIFPL